MHLRSGSLVYPPKSLFFFNHTQGWIVWVAKDAYYQEATAFVNQQHVGHMNFDIVGEMGFLHLIHVEPEARRQGLAKAMLGQLLERYASILWQLGVFPQDEQGLNEHQLFQFYQSFGFYREKRNQMLRQPQE